MIVDNDTIVALTKTQLVAVNRALNELNYLRDSHELNEVNLGLSDSISSILRLELTTKDSIIILQNKELYDQNLFYSTQIDTYEHEIKDIKRKSRIKSIGVGVGGTLLGILIGVLLK